jgi:hypothetical protein
MPVRALQEPPGTQTAKISDAAQKAAMGNGAGQRASRAMPIMKRGLWRVEGCLWGAHPPQRNDGCGMAWRSK